MQGAVTCVTRLVPGGAVSGFVTGGGDSTVRLWQTPSPDGGAAAADFKMLKCIKVRVKFFVLGFDSEPAHSTQFYVRGI